MNKDELKKSFDDKKNIGKMHLYTIRLLPELLGTTNQTLRLYEKHKLIKPLGKVKIDYIQKMM